MITLTEIICACGCGRKKMVRNADIKRGWGKYYSKSCKAKAQEKKTGQYRAYMNKAEDREDYGSYDDIGHPMESGYFGHGQE